MNATTAAKIAFRRIATPAGNVYQAFSADNSIVYTIRRNITEIRNVKLYPWELLIERTVEVCDGLFIHDKTKQPTEWHGVDRKLEAVAYCSTWDASAHGMYSSERNHEAWDAVYALPGAV